MTMAKFNTKSRSNINTLVTTTFLLAQLVLLPVTKVHAHGALTAPAPRINKKCQDRDPHLRYPLTSPSGSPDARSQLACLDQASLAICAGTSKADSSTPPTTVIPGETLNVAWEIGFWSGLALHQGSISISLSKGESEQTGFTALKSVDLTGGDTVEKTPRGVAVVIPQNHPPGPAVLQFKWDAAITKELYINCADLIIGGAGNGKVGNSNSTSTSSGNINSIVPSPTISSFGSSSLNKQSAANNVTAQGGLKNNTPSLSNDISSTSQSSTVSSAVSGASCSSGKTHTVVSGDTCSAISAKQGMQLTDLYTLNPTVNPQCTNLKLGQVLCLSGRGTSGRSGATTASAVTVSSTGALPVPTGAATVPTSTVPASTGILPVSTTSAGASSTGSGAVPAGSGKRPAGVGADDGASQNVVNGLRAANKDTDECETPRRR